MAIQWNILSNALQSNPGEAFNTGMERGVTRAAMGALGQNPNDPRAMNALMAFNPQAGMAMQDRQQAQRTAAANEARLHGEEGRQQQENARAVAERFTGFAQRVRALPPEHRPAVIAQNRANLIAMGVSEQQIDGFDPSDANLDTLISNGMTAPQAAQMESQGGYEIDGIRYNRNNVPVQESPYPRIIPGPDGQFNIQPRIGLEGLRGGAAAPQTPQGAPQAPPAMSEADLRAAAANAIARGADRDAVNQRLEQQLQGLGGPGSTTPATFQRPNEFYIDPGYWQPTDSRR